MRTADTSKCIEPLKHDVGTCYRCHTDIEPMVSKQWFVKMDPLAGPAIEAVEKGDIKFVPDRFKKNYMSWMRGTRDWCISRQLWWGHRIPAWYCDDCGATTVSKSDITACPHCGSSNVNRTPTRSIRGSLRLFGRSQLSAGPTRRATLSIITRPTLLLPATIS